jgi:hypothetical protein
MASAMSSAPSEWAPMTAAPTPAQGAGKVIGIFGFPWWQVALGVVGVGAIGYGIFGGRKRR